MPESRRVTEQVDGADTTGPGAPVLAVRGVSKVFPGTKALDGVDIEVSPGEVHALCGGNGSGKSTLIKILSGVLQGDEGDIRIGRRHVPASAMRPDLAHELGVRVVHQSLSVFPDLSVGENLMLGASFPVTRVGGVRWREVRRRAGDLMDRFDIGGGPDTLLRDLPVAAQSQVAIARAIHDVDPGEGVLILDEPTAALPVHEVRLLFSAVRSLAAEGQAILFVSHRLDEVRAIADRVTVLRDGRVMASHAAADLTEAELIDAIVGRHLDVDQVARRADSDAEPLLRISGLRAGPLRGVDLEVRPGEVVGVAGRLGSGRTELLRAVYGDLPVESGEIVLEGERVAFAHVDQAIAKGVVMIPEDRAADAAFPDMSVDENMDVGVLRRYWRGLGFRTGRLRADAAELRRRYRVRASSGRVAIKSLSGGNQQKAILARWLRRGPVLLLLDEPTQGVDVGARADIHAAVREITDAGGAALVVLSDLEELAQIADWVLTLDYGVVTARVRGDELTAHRLNELIL